MQSQNSARDNSKYNKNTSLQNSRIKSIQYTQLIRLVRDKNISSTSTQKQSPSQYLNDSIQQKYSINNSVLNENCQNSLHSNIKNSKLTEQLLSNIKVKSIQIPKIKLLPNPKGWMTMREIIQKLRKQEENKIQDFQIKHSKLKNDFRKTLFFKMNNYYQHQKRIPNFNYILFHEDNFLEFKKKSIHTNKQQTHKYQNNQINIFYLYKLGYKIIEKQPLILSNPNIIQFRLKIQQFNRILQQLYNNQQVRRNINILNGFNYFKYIKKEYLFCINMDELKILKYFLKENFKKLIQFQKKKIQQFKFIKMTNQLFNWIIMFNFIMVCYEIHNRQPCILKYFYDVFNLKYNYYRNQNNKEQLVSNYYKKAHEFYDNLQQKSQSQQKILIFLKSYQDQRILIRILLQSLQVNSQQSIAIHKILKQISLKNPQSDNKQLQLRFSHSNIQQTIILPTKEQKQKQKLYKSQLNRSINKKIQKVQQQWLLTRYFKAIPILQIQSFKHRFYQVSTNDLISSIIRYQLHLAIYSLEIIADLTDMKNLALEVTYNCVRFIAIILVLEFTLESIKKIELDIFLKYGDYFMNQFKSYQKDNQRWNANFNNKILGSLQLGYQKLQGYQKLCNSNNQADKSASNVKKILDMVQDPKYDNMFMFIQKMHKQFIKQKQEGILTKQYKQGKIKYKEEKARLCYEYLLYLLQKQFLNQATLQKWYHKVIKSQKQVPLLQTKLSNLLSGNIPGLTSEIRYQQLKVQFCILICQICKMFNMVIGLPYYSYQNQKQTLRKKNQSFNNIQKQLKQMKQIVKQLDSFYIYRNRKFIADLIRKNKDHVWTIVNYYVNLTMNVINYMKLQNAQKQSQIKVSHKQLDYSDKDLHSQFMTIYKKQMYFFFSKQSSLLKSFDKKTKEKEKFCLRQEILTTIIQKLQSVKLIKSQSDFRKKKN